MEITGWITAIAGAATALTIILIWKQVRTDHERSRREKAIELLQFWTTMPRPPRSYTPAIRFVEQLNEEQCEHLERLEPFEVGKDLESSLMNWLSEFNDDFDLKRNEDKIILSKQEVILLRHLVVFYLNVLETIATAWRHNVADRDMIEEEFESILSPKKNRFVLETFRRVSGTYPSIAELAEAIKKKQNVRVSKRRVA